MAERKEIAFFTVRICFFIFFLIGFSAEYWVVLEDGHAGLWKACAGGRCIDTLDLGDSTRAAYRSARTLMCYALIAFIASSAAHIMWMLQQPESLLSWAERIMRVSTISGGIVGVLGCIVFWAAIQSDANGFALILAFVSCVWLLGFGLYLTIAHRLPSISNRYENL